MLKHEAPGSDTGNALADIGTVVSKETKFGGDGKEGSKGGQRGFAQKGLGKRGNRDGKIRKAKATSDPKKKVVKERKAGIGRDDYYNRLNG